MTKHANQDEPIYIISLVVFIAVVVVVVVVAVVGLWSSGGLEVTNAVLVVVV